MAIKKTRKILLKQDFLKHGFKKFGKSDNKYISYKKEMGIHDFEILYSNSSIKMDVGIKDNIGAKTYSYYNTVIKSTLILKKSDLSFLLKRCPMYITAQDVLLRTEKQKV